MPSNVEIKAKLADREQVERIAKELSDSGPHLIQQEDIFFRCEGARLKLRILAPDQGELIRYQRDNLAAARTSLYFIARTADPQILLDILTRTLGTIGTVKKLRRLYLIGQTRVHLDQVEGLGDFLELEVVLRSGQEESEGRRTANHLLTKFGIGQDQFVADAYVDLLANATQKKS
jgi:predicted adenylyl cyclase CyaB